MLNAENDLNSAEANLSIFFETPAGNKIEVDLSEVIADGFSQMNDPRFFPGALALRLANSASITLYTFFLENMRNINAHYVTYEIFEEFMSQVERVQDSDDDSDTDVDDVIKRLHLIPQRVTNYILEYMERLFEVNDLQVRITNQLASATAVAVKAAVAEDSSAPSFGA